MRIAIAKGRKSSQWGGDASVFQRLVSGLAMLGIEAYVDETLDRLDHVDHVVLTNTCISQVDNFGKVRAAGKPYSVIPFQEDQLMFHALAQSFSEMLGSVISGQPCRGIALTLAMMSENPDLPRYFGRMTPLSAVINKPLLEGAKVVLPNSPTEASTVRRDAPGARIQVVPLQTDFAGRFEGAAPGLFVDFFRLRPGYAIQVGRLESRKNQLATVIALRDLPVELVFIATRGYSAAYERLVIEAIRKYRKYPTYLIGEQYADASDGVLHTRRTPDGLRLSDAMLGSAYMNAAVQVHPAFHELPGLTYLEGLGFGLKAVCSNFTTIRDYFPDGRLGGLSFVNPHDLDGIRRATVDLLYGGEKVDATPLQVSELDYARSVLRHILG